ncbi:exodeoxyribonuclease VII large subunit [Paenibacillus barengoltzii]|uniref:exodeoxyribonuclease VII large subunit n=1 Tax=Paenibacillus TaxID=44249 RepID=UPI003F50BE82
MSDFKEMPECYVALVTSAQSKATHDVEEVFKRRQGVVYSLYEVKLNNPKRIAAGIFEASESGCDVVMIVRGGGRDTDFLVFDSIEVLQEIYNSLIPVITGLGHRSNLTLADQVADRCETTPTKVAQFLVDKLGQYRNDTRYMVRELSMPYISDKETMSHYIGSKSNGKGKIILLIVVAAVIFIVMMTIFIKYF